MRRSLQFLAATSVILVLGTLSWNYPFNPLRNKLQATGNSDPGINQDRPSGSLDVKPTVKAFNGVPRGKYAVISCSCPPKLSRYVSSIPFSIQAWRRIGYGVIVLLVGTEQQWRNNSLLSLAIDYMAKFGGSVFYLPVANKTQQVRISMVARLFTGNLIKFQDPENTVLATTDSDIWPLNSEFLDLPAGTIFHSLDSCGSFSHKGESYSMLQIVFLVASVQAWMDIMNVPSTPTNADQILQYMVQMFGASASAPVKKGFNNGWFMDQHLVSVKVKNYFSSHPDKKAHLRVSRPFGARMHLWDKPNVLSVVKGKEDAHVTDDMLSDSAWNRSLPLLKALYKGKEIEELAAYRTHLIKSLPPKPKPS